MDSDTPHSPLVIDVTTTEPDRAAAIGAASRRLAASAGQRGTALRALATCFVLGLAVAYFGASRVATWQPSAGEWLGAGVLVLGLGLFLSWHQGRRLVRKLAQAQASAYRLSLDGEGLQVDSESSSARFKWTEVEAIETLPDCLIVHLKGFVSLPVPNRCLPEGMTPAALSARVRQGSQEPAHPVPEAHSVSSPGSASTGLVGDFRRNLVAGAAFLALRPWAASTLVPSVPQLILLLLVPMALNIGLQLWRVGGDGQFNAAGLLPLFFGVPWLLLTAWASARASQKEDLTLAAAVALAALWLVANSLQFGMALLPQEFWRKAGNAGTWLWWGPVAYGYLASVPTLVRTLGMLPEQRLGAVLAVIYLLTVPLFLDDGSQAVFLERQDEAAVAARQARRESAAKEAVLYAQPRLLEAALDGLRPGRPGVPELFLLAVGGYGGQDVFLREVRSVEAMFKERFGTAGHSIVLVNNPATVEDRPIASVTALTRSLERIGQRMNPDEDILFLFMTSHGSPDHRFDLSLWPYRFDDLTPERLRGMLDAAGIRYRVVVVSACYSGGFIAPLAGADTLVMSAAAENRNSHGCSHEADWTFFGRAFFKEALTTTNSFETAFDQASTAVARREAHEGYEPSEPQIAVGNGIRRALMAWERRLPHISAIAGSPP